MKKFPHIARSGDDVTRCLDSMTFPEDVEILHFDLNDFYMTGSSRHLCKHTALMGPRHLRADIRAAIPFLLDYQFVRDRFTDDVYASIGGPGQGTKHSGVVANVSFLHSVELGGIGLATSRFKSRYNIYLYLRYIDNLLFFVSKHKTEELLTVLTSAAFSPYKGKIEERSLSAVTFLDFRIYKGPHVASRGMFAYEPVLKSSVRFQNVDSDHSVGTLLSWPCAYIHRLWRRSSSLPVFRLAKLQFLANLRRSQFSESLVQFFDEKTNFVTPHSAVPRQHIGRRLASVWCPFNYHPAWSNGVIQMTLAKFVRGSEHLHLCKALLPSLQDVPLRIAWRIRHKGFFQSLVAWH